MAVVRVLGRLDRQGFVDCSRLRVTLTGFGVGAALRDEDLPSLHAGNGRRTVRAA